MFLGSDACLDDFTDRAGEDFCGNGVVEGDEECDSGFFVTDTCCTTSCEFAAGCNCANTDACCSNGQIKSVSVYGTELCLRNVLVIVQIHHSFRGCPTFFSGLTQCLVDNLCGDATVDIIWLFLGLVWIACATGWHKLPRCC